ncbi:hypothetical protein AALP_AA6G122000 [Arabis alpina]|uniref:Uncharacterized protein n=1 Tax=Arabis alpina TaxID=50452 RepID=A0A087GNQ7_ARAAL|nr:hypothetical protein AALP_AA6G122000 [Arabis alpina]
MEEKKLNFDAPFLSVRRISTKQENTADSDNTKNKKIVKTKRRRKAKESCQETTKHETQVRLLKDDRSFDHVMETSLVPFKWEQTPGKPKGYHTLIEESDLIKASDMVSSTASFSVNCSSNETSDEFEKNVSKDDVIMEYRDLMMSRFLPDAKAIALKQKEESSPNQNKKKQKKKRSIALERVSMAINQDLNNDNDDDYDHDHVDGIAETVLYSNASKKAQVGFLPRFCSKNSLDVFNPVLSRVKTCQDLGVKSGEIVNPKSIDSLYKTQSPSLPRILRSNKVMSKSQELYPLPRFSKEISRNSLSKSGEIIRIPRNHPRLKRTASDQIQRQVTRFLVEEVKRRRNGDKIRSSNLSKTSQISVPQPPLPKTPSESWLCRTLPRSSAASMVSGQLSIVVSGQTTGFKKVEQKTNSQSIKWETIVKTSYKHHDHVRYSEELIVVHPSRQHKL